MVVEKLSEEVLELLHVTELFIQVAKEMLDENIITYDKYFDLVGEKNMFINSLNVHNNIMG